MADLDEVKRELTFGEKAVGLTFNHGEGDTFLAVQDIKTKAAAFIDKCNDLRAATEDGEQKRMYAIAITEAQTAQMWAVKAVTWQS